MATIQSKYELGEDPPHILQIVIDEEVLNVIWDGHGANQVPSGGVTIPITVYSNMRRRESGIHCRGIQMVWTGSAPTGYNPSGRLFIPVMRLTRWRQLKVGNTLTHLGQQGKIVSKIPELIS